MTLTDVAERTSVLALACTRCDRAGQYRLKALIRQHGAGLGIPDLLRILSADCPKRQAVSWGDQCGFCPELPKLFMIAP